MDRREHVITGDVVDPGRVHTILTEHMHAHVEAPYLKKMSEQLEDISKKLDD